MRLRPPLLPTLAAALGLSLAASAVGAAERITNIARATWTENGSPRSTESNAVTTEIDDGARITTFHEEPAGGAGGAGAVDAPVRSTCRGRASVFTPGTSGSRGLVTETRSVTAGEELVFRLTYPRGNADPAAVEQMIAELKTGAGDREMLTVFETGPDTGEFTGSMPTAEVPPQPEPDDCVLSVVADDKVTITYEREVDGPPVASATVDVLADPFGRVFDSDDGGFVSGVRVSMVDAVTGAPARVFAPNGVTRWPSSVITGQPVTDAAGRVYPGKPGRYHFPLAPEGSYRLRVEPPAPYTAPSVATRADLARLARPNGRPFTIVDASFGGAFPLQGTAVVRVDIPVDRPTTPALLTKTASRASAQPGDPVLYTIAVRNPDPDRIRRDLRLVDALPPQMRLRPGSIRVSDTATSATVTVAPDGRSLTVDMRRVLAGATRTITYALEVRPDAKAGQAINNAVLTDAKGVAVKASAAVRIDRETIAARMTVIGRVVDAPCTARPPFPKGVAGVRVMLEDGSYAVTDPDGRYHFEGVVPGSHVVQVDASTLPGGAALVDCARSTRSAGNAGSRFVEGRGGALVSADFHLVRAAPAASAVADKAVPAPISDKAAAGGERDWFADGKADVAWLFPEADHNPRAPAVRVAIRHLPGQTIVLSADGKPVDPVTFDGTRNHPTGGFSVSLWRGVPLRAGVTRLRAEVRGKDGAVAAKLDREVSFVSAAARAEYLPGRSRLVADGVARPVIAVRITDRAGRPVHAGSTGDFALPAPYEPAAAVDAEQARMLSGLERAAPVWRVAGDDGVAYVQLAPTGVSGLATVDFSFREGGQLRRQRLEAWLEPGDRPWTLVGLAEGRLGANVEPIARENDRVDAGGRIAFYAKGRIKGSWLLTIAYDSDKRRDDQRLTGAIDPNTYYTVYADRSERRFDAASTRKLYVKLERRQFYALFGDFTTGFVETELGRYVRAATGFKGEYRGERVAAQAFAARFPTTHRRDEIQGSGLSVGYALRSRGVLANSERVVVEVRDRLRSERIVERRTLARFVDYDIDYQTGAIRFSAPVLSRSSALDPQFIVVDYEVMSAVGGEVNAGARATATLADGRVRVGATGLRDAGDQGRTTLGAVDARVRLGADTELRAEAAGSKATGTPGVDAAWLVEVEHHDADVDVLAYARQLGDGYGVEQQNTAERGRRKIGVDGRLRVTDAVSVTASGWTDRDLSGDARRRAARVRAEYKGQGTDLRLGLTHADDRVAADRSATSTLLEAGATQRLLDNRLEMDLATGLALGRTDSIDFPVQHRLGARFQVTPDVALVGAYEIASGDAVDARTVRIGFDVAPWAGARVTSTIADQDIPEYGRRAYAAYGLAQSLRLSPRWSVDATIDGARTLGGVDPGRVVNPAQPIASGGFVGSGNTIVEDFTATTLGATYRGDAWSGTARGEYRFGDLGDRAGATLGVIRRLGEGATLGLLAAWTRADTLGGATTETLDVAASAALRPAADPVAALGKLAWREDRVTGAVAGGVAPVFGTAFNVTGDARSRRVVGSLSVDYAPYGRDEGGAFQRSEASLFLGARHVFDRIDGYDLGGTSLLVGLDGRFGIGERIELGLGGSLRGDVGRGHFDYAFGPTVGVRPARDMLVSLGWNVHGFADRDFTAARQTQEGPFVSWRMKFDRNSFDWLGGGR